MNIGIMLNGHINVDLKKCEKFFKIDKWITVDKNPFMLKQKITVDVAIGDFDSSYVMTCQKLIKFPKEKDYTDGYLALQYVLNNYNNIDEIFIFGFEDDERYDHLFNNLITLSHDKVRLINRNTLIFYKGKSFTIPYIKNCNYFSIFNLAKVEDLSIINAKYSINKLSFDANQFLGISNEFIENENVTVSFKNKSNLIIFINFKE